MCPRPCGWYTEEPRLERWRPISYQWYMTAEGAHSGCWKSRWRVTNTSEGMPQFGPLDASLGS